MFPVFIVLLSASLAFAIPYFLFVILPRLIFEVCSLLLDWFTNQAWMEAVVKGLNVAADAMMIDATLWLRPMVILPLTILVYYAIYFWLRARGVYIVFTWDRFIRRINGID